MRKQRIDSENEAKRQEKEQVKMSQVAQGAGRRVYRSPGEDGKTEEEKNGSELETKMILEEYARVVHKNTELFSTYDPDTLLGTLNEYAETMGASITLAKDKYKAKLSANTESGKVDIKVRVLKVSEDKYCVEFNRVSGDQLDFFNAYNTIRDFFGPLNNTAF